MDRRERYEDEHIALLASLKGWQADLWTALPGIIDSFDASKLTCSVQPAIQALFTSPTDGSQNWVNLPLLVDCPVVFPAGGGCTLTFPLTKGDECLVVFSSRCIDAWWQSGGVQPQAMLRMHDLSDGFVFVGIKSKPNFISVNTSETQLRSNDGSAVIGLNSTTHNIHITTSGVTTVSAPSILLQNAGSALKKLIKETFIPLFNSHTHPSGTPNTGVPNQQSTSDLTSIVQAE